MNPILSKHKFCLKFMTKFLTFKTFILDLRQILDLRPFVNPSSGPVFMKGLRLSQVLGLNPVLKLRLLSQLSFVLKPYS